MQDKMKELLEGEIKNKKKEKASKEEVQKKLNERNKTLNKNKNYFNK